MLVCTKCKEPKVSSAFTVRLSRKRGFESACKDCRNLGQRLAKYGRVEKVRKFTNRDSPYTRATGQLARNPNRVFAGIGCWEWTGKITHPRGYASFTIEGKPVGVHR